MCVERYNSVCTFNIGSRTWLSAEMLDGCPTALPPVLEISGDYEDWRASVYAWRDVTDVPQNQQALELFLRLRGDAKDALLGLTVHLTIRMQINLERVRCNALFYSLIVLDLRCCGT